MIYKEEEKADGLNATVLAYDGIAIIVNPENPVSDLDVETIAKIYTGEITNWSEVGGNDAEIVLVGREAGSGTRDGFKSITDTEDACKYRQELTSTGDVITTVSQNPDAIGYASVAAVKESVEYAISLETAVVKKRTLWNNEFGIFGAFPATIITAIASPIARPTPNTTAAVIPLFATGTDTLK